MRILHTSDWHLGLSSGPVSRSDDHALFFDWLLDTIETRRIDTLLLAGDVFDTLQPSSEALRLYYRFLARLTTTSLRQMVIIAGNHDSASRLEAPRDLLTALKIHVLGTVSADASSWESALIPLEGPSGEVEAVVSALPYVHEYRLGIRTTDLDQQAAHEAFQRKFSEIFTHLADLAEARHPHAMLLGMGHLTLGAARREDYPHEIHQVGRVEALNSAVFDPRYRYVALGHIHRCYPVDEARRLWYSGSPIPCSIEESKTPRRVLELTLVDGQVSLEKLDVPSFRSLVKLDGSPESLLKDVAALTWTTPLPPLLYIEAQLSAPHPTLSQELLERLPEGARLVDFKQILPTSSLAIEHTMPALHTLTPNEVFQTLCEARGVETEGPLTRAFSSLSSMNDEAFEQHLTDLDRR